MEIKTVNLTKENLQIICNIDDTFYTNAITGIDWYLKRYNEKHTAIFLYDGDKAVSYLASVPIKKELYDAISNGVLTNDLYVNPNMFVNNSNFNYIISCVILDGYRGKGFASLMMDKLFKNAEGHYIAITISNDGKKLAQKYLNVKTNIDDSIAIFDKVIR